MDRPHCGHGHRVRRRDVHHVHARYVLVHPHDHRDPHDLCGHHDVRHGMIVMVRVAVIMFIVAFVCVVVMVCIMVMVFMIIVMLVAMMASSSWSSCASS